MKILKKIAITASLACMALPALAQDRKVDIDWAPKPKILKDYTGVNTPVTRIKDVLARHKGEKSWSQDVIATARYSARWIQMAPGEKTKTALYVDDRTVWVVWGGQIRFSIYGQEPFIAKKGFLVQVPLRVPFSMETVGDEPSLRFEVTRGGSLPSFPANKGEPQPPKPDNGQHYVRVSLPPTLVAGGMDSYDKANKPYMDFFKDYIEKYPTGGPRGEHFVHDADNQAAIIRGMGVPTPPDSNKGHFHIANDEFWFVLEGKIDYLIEGKGLITADTGDVVLALPGRFHRASWAAGQMDTRLAFNRSPVLLHAYEQDAGGKQ